MSNKQSEQSDNIYTNITLKVAKEIERRNGVITKIFTAKQPYLIVKGR
jgi:hypothetical protein